LLNRTKYDDNLFEIAKILGQQTDFNEVLRIVAQESSQMLKADLALVLMLNPDTRETVKTIFKEGQSVKQKEYLDIHIHIGGWIITNRKPFLSHHIQKDDRFAKGLFDKVPIKAVIGVPLVIEGIIIGALMMLYRDSSDFINKTSTELLENIAAISVPFLRNVQKLRKYFLSSVPEKSLIQKYKNAGLYGKSPRFIELLYAIEAASKCDVRILLVGKTGTGKEIIARAIHKFSAREKFPFTAVDCGAIPQTLLESELFGHKRGAFTGAHSDRQGLFLEANGGTLFMDEINNLPYDMQSKLLRVLEESEIRPVGSDQTININVRIIAASSVPLKNLVDENLFREDLYYRLHVYPINIPDLSERPDDIPLLADHFLHHYSRQQNKNVKNFHEEVIDFMKQHNWNGHVRELENFIERMVTVASPDALIIDSSYFPIELQNELKNFRKKINASSGSEALKEQVNKYEADLIKKTLIECKWNQSEAARRLKTSEKNIRYKIEKLNIQKPEVG